MNVPFVTFQFRDLKVSRVVLLLVNRDFQKIITRTRKNIFWCRLQHLSQLNEIFQISSTWFWDLGPPLWPLPISAELFGTIFSLMFLWKCGAVKILHSHLLKPLWHQLLWLYLTWDSVLLFGHKLRYETKNSASKIPYSSPVGRVIPAGRVLKDLEILWRNMP